jgi:hypothetical protein
VALDERVGANGCGTEAHAREGAGGIVGEVPVTDAVVRLREHEAERALLVGAGDQGKRFVETVTQAGIDVPPPRRVVVGAQVVHHEHEVVRERGRAGSVRSVHATDVPRHPVAERAEQFGQRAVEVEAVSASLVVRDAVHRLGWIDGPARALVDPRRLVRHGLDLRPVDPMQSVGRGRLALQAEPAEIGSDIVARVHGR